MMAIIPVSPHESRAKEIAERAWLCAYVLAYEYPRRLTIAQRIACEIALMRGLEDAPLAMIALAADVVGHRQ